MAIPLADQHSYATAQHDFRAKVAAAVMDRAITAFSAAPNADAAVQVKRLALANAVLRDVHTYLTPFAWVVITRPALTAVSDLDGTAGDAAIKGILTPAVFDAAAAQLITTTPA